MTIHPNPSTTYSKSRSEVWGLPLPHGWMTWMQFHAHNVAAVSDPREARLTSEGHPKTYPRYPQETSASKIKGLW